ncbi:MAG: hypothetical protein JWO89_1826, partial [Verrucomicrobiaceae bacterium]|nr:hypothetical protein [Verrucomicrobiaceae bacterium]
MNAASSTWLNTGTVDGSWGTTSNWVGGIVPGVLSGTTNTDTATFNTALGTFGTIGNPIVIDAGRNLRSLTFDTAVGNYVIGSTGGNKLLLTTAGTIQIPATLTATNAQITINAPLEIQTSAGTYTFTNNSANGIGAGAGTLTFGGAITGATGSATLTLAGSNTNANTISGVLGNGTGSGLALTKSGAGTWVLAGLGNNYTGVTTVSAGTLSITGSITSNTSFVVTGGTLSLAGSITGGSAITVTGGTLTESATGIIGPGAASLIIGGTATLAGANTYTGATTVNVGGTVQLTGTTGAISGTSVLTVNTNGLFIHGDTTTATNNDGITNRVKAATTLTLNGGTFQLAAGSAGTHAQS